MNDIQDRKKNNRVDRLMFGCVFPVIFNNGYYLVRQHFTKCLASSENCSGNGGIGLSEPIANMAAIGFTLALKNR